ncbi:MAG: diguanylate cyclase [Pseudomonas sp.]|nr:MAG: diguanylate cyclase [Pseudomonas sp.]
MSNSSSNAVSLSSVRLASEPLFKFVALLAGVFLLAGISLVYLAQDLDRTEQEKNAFYVRKAVQSLEKSLAVTVQDYAFWGDAYRHLHAEVDTEWAYINQNIGPTLYDDFGFQGLFVVDDQNRTVYSVIDGKQRSEEASDWLLQPIAGIADAARAGAEAQTSVTRYINVGGAPAVMAAAAITPGTDPTVTPDNRAHSVLIFVDVLEPKKLAALGIDFGVAQLRVASHGQHSADSVVTLADDGGTLQWTPAQPGWRLLAGGLPLIGLAALLVALMTWVILRRTTVAAQALDASIASLKRSQAALATSEARFRDVAEASSDWIWEIDAALRFTYLSERFQGVTGLSSDTWLGANIDDLLTTELGMLSQWLSIPNRRPEISVQCRYLDARGQARITRLSARTLPDGGVRGTATDVTEEVEARRRIEFLSQHDALTGLPNRTRLQAFLDGKLKAQPTVEQPLVMLCLDLDRFKPVNDLLGHAAGDRVLNEVSSRLADCVRHADLVARVGGDEFVLIVTDVSSQEEVETLCRRLIASIEMPIAIEDQEVFISASIGIAMAPHDACEATALLRYADIALYEAKSGGRNTWRFYAGDMNARIIERRRLESDLRQAIKNGELELHFQPRYRIADGQMVGAEALVRWQHPLRGQIAPDVFVPIAEESGLILALSNWVLEQACRNAANWPAQLFVSVNLSPSEFKRGNLIERIQHVLSASNIAPARLELEITEGVMLDDAAGALEIMRTLKRETADHLKLLQAVACDEGQGYYLSRPLGSDAFRALSAIAGGVGA